jgi:FMN phosphatase YigB (HAD superfamily)
MRPVRLKALLLDLDDTLIDNPMDSFIPAYFAALEAWVDGVVVPARFIAELKSATRAMAANDGAGPTNEEVFAAAFYPGLGVPRAELEPLLDRFYREAFPGLAPLTAPRPAAPRILEWALARGLQVVIATNPLFPRSAIEQRMAWGGIGVDRFRYDLVTSYENCRATKSHPAYYREILAALGRRADECLMVGDRWDWDVACADAAGIPSYWIAAPAAAAPAAGVEPVGRGSLDDFLVAAVGGAFDADHDEPTVREAVR